MISALLRMSRNRYIEPPEIELNFKFLRKRLIRKVKSIFVDKLACKQRGCINQALLNNDTFF